MATVNYLSSIYMNDSYNALVDNVYIYYDGTKFYLCYKDSNIGSDVNTLPYYGIIPIYFESSYTSNSETTATISIDGYTAASSFYLVGPNKGNTDGFTATQSIYYRKNSWYMFGKAGQYLYIINHDLSRRNYAIGGNTKPSSAITLSYYPKTLMTAHVIAKSISSTSAWAAVAEKTTTCTLASNFTLPGSDAYYVPVKVASYRCGSRYFNYCDCEITTYGQNTCTVRSQCVNRNTSSRSYSPDDDNALTCQIVWERTVV